MKKKPFEWLERSFVTGPYYTLCRSEDAFLAAVKHCDLKLTHNDFIPWAGANKAATHFLENEDGSLCAVVCINGAEKHTGIVIAGLLVHEAVHVFQRWCSSVGEHSPSNEFQAYSIQWLSQQLMWEFERQTTAPRSVRR